MNANEKTNATLATPGQTSRSTRERRVHARARVCVYLYASKKTPDIYGPADRPLRSQIGSH